ncbi:MAG: site-2 protease family protein [Phycisphaerales bacterium]|nr:site-2 protease family protein [Planctomycetota bacterium]MCH8508646.1 site-2 protease family protein [Phycisphaerales bacterium]
MFELPGVTGTLANLAVIIIGFGGIIFVHELGHFLAAKWAGIRVLAFSMGMGPILFSYRKGMGLRRGSTEPDYRRMLAAEAEGVNKRDLNAVSPTEYRFSALPIGGYVKMLGQEDANPGAVSEAADSYQNCPVWKRMVVISAGVVMNLISAAILFVIVFMVGLKVQPPVIGSVAPNSPAAAAIAISHEDIPPGLLPEDTILEVEGHRMRAFNEVATEVAMSGRGRPVRLLVDRPGVEEPIVFEASARADRQTGLLDLGIGPAVSGALARWKETDLRDRYAQIVGLAGLNPGDRLVAVNDVPVGRPTELLEAVRASGGHPVHTLFQRPDGATVPVTITPARALQAGSAVIAGDRTRVEHLLGLRPLLRVDPAASPEDTRQGLEPGDILIRIGDADFPSREDAMARIRAAAGKPLQLEVLRAGERITLDTQVSRAGTIGFFPDSTAAASAVVAAPSRLAPIPASDPDNPDADPPPTARTPAHELIDRPGTRILAIADRPVANLLDLPDAILAAAEDQPDADTVTIPVTLELPLPHQPDGRAPTETRDWTLTRDDIDALRALDWSLPGGDLALVLFEMEQTIDKAATPLAAVARGISKSRQVMNQTYLTFLRLFQGTVRVTHLKGPVGIAHLGTQVADQGFIWVLFFLGLVSVNLAVINFLPLPIVDGGQFLMLCYEGIRRKPVPIVFQNVATLAGLALIGAVFLIVTFNDIRALFGA